MNETEENPGSQIGGILWNIGKWIRRRPWAASAVGAALSGLITVFGFGKDPRNGLVYLSEPVLNAIREIVQESERRQNAKIESVVEVLQAFKDYDSAQARVDARRADEATRAARRKKLLGMDKPDSLYPFNPATGITSREISHGFWGGVR